MKKYFLIAVAVLFCACEVSICDTISGTWSGYVITANGTTFRTNNGVRGIDIPVEIYERHGHWYIYGGEEITPIY